MFKTNVSPAILWPRIGGIIIVVLLPLIAPGKDPVQIGQTAPQFSGLVQDVRGKLFQSNNYFGQNPYTKKFPPYRAVVLIFTARDCLPCQRELPQIKNFYQQWKPKGVEIIMIGRYEKRQAFSEYAQTNLIPWPMVPDPYANISNQYDAHQLPRIFVLDKTGKIVDIIIGEDKEIDQKLVRTIATINPVKGTESEAVRQERGP